MRPAVPVFFDFACPYSYASRPRERRLAKELDVTLVHVPWPIHPDVPQQGEPDPEADPTDDMKEFAQRNGATIPRRPLRFNTRKALLGLPYARAHGRAEAYLDRVFRAYAEEQQNVAEDAVLERLATESGLDGKAFLASLRSGEWQPALDAASAYADSLGVESTVTFVVDGKPYAALEGPAELERRLAKAAKSG